MALLKKEAPVNLERLAPNELVSAYNLPTSTLSDVDIAFIKRRHFKLIEQEIAAAHPANHLPTIGFEVESPRKPYRLVDPMDYADLFDRIGMPRNKVNESTGTKDGTSYPTYWEFSPPPSYTASVQARILHELIAHHEGWRSE